MIIVFDTETNGKVSFDKPAEDECQPRLVQLGALLLDHDLKTIGELNVIVKPNGFKIPAEFSAIHGTELSPSHK